MRGRLCSTSELRHPHLLSLELDFLVSYGLTFFEGKLLECSFAALSVFVIDMIVFIKLQVSGCPREWRTYCVKSRTGLFTLYSKKH